MALSFVKLWKKLCSDQLSVDDLTQYANQCEEYAGKVLMGQVDPNDPELEAFLRLCLDVYTYSSGGDVLIPDSQYDFVMNVYKGGGNHTIVYADAIGQTKWNFVKHKIPGIVGTISKIYTYEELKKYLRSLVGVSRFILAPKYDGISVDIEVDNGKVISATTRYDGIIGQDITMLVLRASNIDMIIDDGRTGHYKCELVVSTEHFNELVKIKKYKNRRSATSGIVNTPSNIDLGKYITILPLAFYNPMSKEFIYLAPGQKEVEYLTPYDLMEDIEKMLESIRTADFPFRVDGVVINPDRTYLGAPNELDLMDVCMAFKVNTAEGKTHIRYGYMSVGRLGKAVPCLKVEPVEVNETIVEDASLGSYAKFLSMDLREHEEVIVYSAGDVIPQVKLPQLRMNLDNSDLLKIPRVCPYCGEKLERVNAEYFCVNPNCERIITGRIANFLSKLGVQGFSDRSVELIYESLHIDNLVDFLNLTVEQLTTIEGFSTVSATNLVSELTKLKQTPVTQAKFFGALGIDKISEKKSRKILEYVSLADLFGDKPMKKIMFELEIADGIGRKTASTFISFFTSHRDEIYQLVQMMNLGPDVAYSGNIVFTGFRPPTEVQERIRALHYDISDSVTGSTIAVFTASLAKDSTKTKVARNKGIPVYHASDLNQFLDELELRDD